MPERIDPDVEPSLDLEAPASNEQPPVDQPRWRRPVLLVAGASLLTLGAFVNADRFDWGADERRELASEEEPPPEEAERTDDAAGGVGTRHRGEEGKMGKPSAKSKSGLYAMKGPAHAVPSMMARDFDPGSPYGGAYAVGNDDEDVWGGLSGSQAVESDGVGLIGIGHGGGGIGEAGEARNTAAERYAELLPNLFVTAAEDPKSTFSIDVDTASYANVRRFLLSDNQLPPPAAVRTEELINYFDYDYPQPSGAAPFSLTTEVGPCPWNPENRLVHVGVQGKIIDAGATPPRNLVFLLDVSGSMAQSDKLPLVKHGLAALTEQLGERDRVSIVVYAGAAGVVLPPTSGADKQAILDALDQLESGGSTNGGEGIELAYALAERNFMKGGVNRVVLATDGDFNVGISSHDALIEMIEKQRETGVFLSVLGFGTDNLNDHTMEQLADKGNGNYAYIDGMFEARKVLVAEAGATLVTIAKDVKIQVEFDPDQVAQHRLVGYENRVMAHHEFDDDQKDAGEIGAGHSVTALYEIVPKPNADDDPLLQLSLRYKQPDGDESRKIAVAVEADDQPLADSSDDYRFAAAVAAFSERLRGAPAPSYAQIMALAEGALGADAQCYRHQFLELVRSAASLSGEELGKPESRSCTPKHGSAPRHTELESPHEQHTDADAQSWQAFVLEVLRLLPPFLALPMFVMALRKPRRRS
ncbi:MAG TPA: VWA domain-containing protein [Enhygromyxa sp.]|nr:VWA domain-containing protein [Enhygromyxa sp.]